MDAIYTVAEECGLILLLHAGFDIAFPRNRVADPQRLIRVADRFPKLKIIAAHLGAWMDWDEVQRHLVGRPIYFDISCCFDFMDRAQARTLLQGHPTDWLLFGSDSPWVDQQKTMEDLRSFDLGPDVEARVLGGNARQLLKLEHA